MKIVIFWSDILHYHVARIKALIGLSEDKDYKIYPIALSSRSKELPLIGYQDLLRDKIVVLSNSPSEAGPYSQNSKKSLLKSLDRILPDVVAIIGYDGVVARSALGWCRYHNKGAVLMFAGQEDDFETNKDQRMGKEKNC